MAYVTGDFDDVLPDLEFVELECPECGTAFVYNVANPPPSVICPHCKVELDVDFETDDDDGDEDSEDVELECPDCGKAFTYNLEDAPKTVTCPHCKADLDINIEWEE